MKLIIKSLYIKNKKPKNFQQIAILLNLYLFNNIGFKKLFNYKFEMSVFSVL